MKNVQIISLLQQGEFPKINVQKDSTDLLPNEFTELRNVEIDQAGKIVKCGGFASFGGTNSASAHDIFEYEHQGQGDRIFIARDDNSLAKWVYAGASYGGNSASITYNSGTADWDRLRFNVRLDVLRAGTGNGAGNLPIWYDYINRAMFANASAAPGYYLTHAGIKPGFIAPKGNITANEGGTGIFKSGSNWFIYDYNTNKLIKFNNKLQSLKNIGGENVGGYSSIQDIVSDGTHIYFVDAGNGRIEKRKYSDLTLDAVIEIDDSSDKYYGMAIWSSMIFNIWWDDDVSKTYVQKRNKSDLSVVANLDITTPGYADTADSAQGICYNGEETIFVHTWIAGPTYFLLAIDITFTIEKAQNIGHGTTRGMGAYHDGLSPGDSYIYMCIPDNVRKYNYDHSTTTFSHVNFTAAFTKPAGLYVDQSNQKIYVLNGDYGAAANNGCAIGKLANDLSYDDYLVDTVVLLRAVDNAVDTGMTGGTTYNYKFSLLYDDGFESPLPTVYLTSESITVGKSCDLYFYAKTTNRRISHIKIYRQHTNWKLLDTISMNDGRWSASIANYHLKYTDQKADADIGDLYSDITGLAETTENIEVNFKYSRHLADKQWVALGYVLGDKLYPNFVFPSKLNKPDVFDWANDFIRIPGQEPITGLAIAFDRLVVFTEKSFHIINPYTSAIEDSYFQSGALTQELIVEVEDTIYFADGHNIWELSGRTLNNISQEFIGTTYEAIASKSNGVAKFDKIRQNIWFCFAGTSWLFNPKLRSWHKRVSSEEIKRILMGINDEIWTTDLDDIVQRDISGYTESVQARITTGFILNSDSYKILRRFYIDFKSGNQITIHFYKDDDGSNYFYRETAYATATNRTKRFIQIPQRFRNLKIQIIETGTNDFELYGMGVAVRPKGL